jgi:hypothetical protein
MPKYPLDSYDDYLCLKPPLLLWLAVLYLSRAISLPLAITIGRFAGASTDATAFLQSVATVYTLLPSALAAGVLYAMCRRQPSASAAVRWIWARGRSLLAAAAVIDFALTAYAVTRIDSSEGLPLSLGITAAFDVYFLLYILLVRRVRDTFARFPLLVSQ